MIPSPPSSTLFPYTTLFRSLPYRVWTKSLIVLTDNDLRLIDKSSTSIAKWYAGSVSPIPKGFSIYGKSFRRSEEHTSELQSRRDLVCRLLLEKKKIKMNR